MREPFSEIKVRDGIYPKVLIFSMCSILQAVSNQGGKKKYSSSGLKYLPEGLRNQGGHHVVRHRDAGLNSSEGLVRNDSWGMTPKADLWSLYLSAYTDTHTHRHRCACIHTHKCKSAHPSNNKRMYISGSLSSVTTSQYSM